LGEDHTNTEKLDQLLRNIQEDYAREEIQDFSKGVLFGNAHWLKDPAERQEWFTAKCVSGAKRFGVSLVRTIDLFIVARYVKESGDAQFAEVCRKVIFDSSGEVSFPEIPHREKPEPAEQAGH
jgi:hypothetical protein